MAKKSVFLAISAILGVHLGHFWGLKPPLGAWGVVGTPQYFFQPFRLDECNNFPVPCWWWKRLLGGLIAKKPVFWAILAILGGFMGTPPLGAEIPHFGGFLAPPADFSHGFTMPGGHFGGFPGPPL